jgi:glycine cleavage system H protein
MQWHFAHMFIFMRCFMLKFSDDHEWVRVEGSVGTVGISDFAQDALGDIVFVELPEVGRQLAVGDEAAVIESVKAAGEVKSPVSGEVIEVNQALVDEPSLMNSAPEGEGWVYKIQLADLAELDGLMDEAAYRDFAQK